MYWCVFLSAKGTIYQGPILTMENMMAGILGSVDGAVLMRPQPWLVADTDITVFMISFTFNGIIACDTRC